MTLSKYLKISSGRSFRGAIKSVADGQHRVIQMRDIEWDDDEYHLKTNDFIKTEIKSNRAISVLQNGDILMSSKGSLLRAFILKDIPENTVCTQHFFILTPNEPKNISAEFIIAIINMPVNQRWLNKRSSGSYQKMLTQKTLSEMPFPAMSLVEQTEFLKLCSEAKEEKKLLMQLIENRDKQLASLIDEYVHAK